MFRLIFVTFFGTYRGDVPAGHAAHHSTMPPWVMEAPVILLMIPSVAAGYVAIGGDQSAWWKWFVSDFGTRTELLAPPPFSELASTGIVLAVVAVGVGIAYLRYGTAAATRGAVERLRLEAAGIPQPFVRAFYFDDLIGAVFVRPARALGEAFSRFVDPQIIDAAVTDVARLAGLLGRELRGIQTGLVRAYAFVLVGSAVVFMAYFALLRVPR
jgi:NADH-quinone oxidoreductase subunit L